MGNTISEKNKICDEYKNAALYIMLKNTPITGSGPSLFKDNEDNEKENVEHLIRLLYKCLKSLFNLEEGEKQSITEIMDIILQKIPELLSPNVKINNLPKEITEKVKMCLADAINNFKPKSIDNSASSEKQFEQIVVFINEIKEDIIKKYLTLKDKINSAYYKIDLLENGINNLLNLKDDKDYSQEEYSSILQSIKLLMKYNSAARSHLRGLTDICVGEIYEKTEKHLIPHLTIEQIVKQISNIHGDIPKDQVNTLVSILLIKDIARRSFMYYKMLSNLDISISEYREKIKDIDEFRTFIAEKSLEKLKNAKTEEALDKIMEAIKYLNNEEIIPPSELEKEVKGRAEESYNATNNKVLQVVLNAFGYKFVFIFNKIRDKIKSLTDNVVSMTRGDISILKKIYKFLLQLPSLSSETILIILSDICPDINSQQKKELFINTIQNIVDNFEIFSKTKPNLTVLSEIKDLFKEILKIVTEFGTQLKERVGTIKIGGSDITYPAIQNISFEISVLKKQIIYYIKLVSLLSSLHNEAEVVKHYESRTNEVDGRWTAELRNELHPELQSIITKIKITKAFVSKDKYKHNINALKIMEKYVKIIREVKDELWKTGESFNEYLRRNYSDIREDPSKNLEKLQKVLYYSEISSMMITPQGSNALWRLMESFPGVSNDHITYIGKLNEISTDLLNIHYFVLLSIVNDYVLYQEIIDSGYDKYISQELFDDIKNKYKHTIPTGDGLPGNPLIPLPIINVSRNENKLDTINRLLDTVVSDPLMKNFWSLVFSIGYNETNAKENTYMTYKQMYRNIIRYIKISSVVPVLHADRQSVNMKHKTIFSGSSDNWSYNDKKFNWGNIPCELIKCNEIRKCFNTGHHSSLFKPKMTFTDKEYETYLTPEVQCLTNIILRPCECMCNDKKTPLCVEMFKQTDDLLINMIRAAAVKVISMTRLIVSQTESAHVENLNYNSTMRKIIGAADESEFTDSTTFNEKFVSVLVRLPLLIELTQLIYKFNSKNSYDYIIKPMLTDEFHPLFQTIYYVLLTYNGQYIPDLSDKIIKMIYKIVQNHPNDDANTIIVKAWNSFVKRATLVSGQYMMEYLNALKGNCLSYQQGQFIGDVKLKPIDNTVDSKFSNTPSNKYLKNINILESITSDIDFKKTIPNLTLLEHRDIISCICDRFEHYIKTYAPNISDNDIDYTLDNYISNVEQEIKMSKTLVERMIILRKTLNEGQVSGTNTMLTLVGWNENVVAPLLHLYGIFNILNDLFSKIHDMVIAVDLLNDNNISFTELEQKINSISTNIKTDDEKYVSESFEYKPVNNDIWNDLSNAYIERGFSQQYAECASMNGDFDSLEAYAAIYDNIDQLPVKWKDLKKLISINVEHPDRKVKDYARNVYSRYALDQKKIFILLYEIIQSFQIFNGYTTVNIANDKFEVNIQNLVHDIVSTFTAVNQNLIAFLPHISKQIYDKHVLLTYDGKDNVGSYYWLVEKLLNKIILDKPENKFNDNIIPGNLNIEPCDFTTDLTKLLNGQNNWLRKLNDNIEKIIQYLNTEWTVNSRVIHYNGTLNSYITKGSQKYTPTNIMPPVNVDLRNTVVHNSPGQNIVMTDTITNQAFNYVNLRNQNYDITVANNKAEGSLSIGYLSTITANTGIWQEHTIIGDIHYGDIDGATFNTTSEVIHPIHQYTTHSIGFPKNLNARDPKNPARSIDVNTNPTNYFPEIMSLLYVDIKPFRKIPSHVMHLETKPNSFKVNTFNNIYSFMFNKTSKKIGSVDLAQSFIPNILSLEADSFVSFFHGDNSYNQCSPRSLIIEFNQLIGLLLEHSTQIPFDKVFSELIMNILDGLAVEIGNIKDKLKDVLVVKKEFQGHVKELIKGFEGLGNRDQRINNVEAGWWINLYKNRDFQKCMDKRYGMMYNAREFEKVYNKGFYAEPLLHQYWNTNILCQSLAAALHQIQHAKGNNDKPLFIEPDINELSSHYKEKLKTILIMLRCYFTTLLQRIIIYNGYVLRFSNNMYQSSNTFRYSTDPVTGRDQDYTAKYINQAALRGIITTRINNLMKYCNVVIKSINKTLIIFHDKPVLGQLTVDCDPMNTAIFPSFITTLYQEVKNTWDEDNIFGDDSFIPQHPLGDPKHKLQCALRYFFNISLTSEGTQYCTPVLMNTDNTISFKFENTLIEHEMKKINTLIPKLSNWVTHLNRCSRIALFNIQRCKIDRLFTYTPSNQLFIVTENNNPYLPYKSDILCNINQNFIFPIMKMKTQDVIQVLETKMLSEQYKLLFSHYEKGQNILYDRNSLRVINLVDNDITLIGAHMFMQDTPFAVMLFYSSKYDKVIDEITSDRYTKYYINRESDDNLNYSALKFGRGEGGCPCDGACDCPKDIAIYGSADEPSSPLPNPHSLFVRLLKDPFMNIDYNTYCNSFRDIMRGEIEDADLLAPKFLDKPFYDVLMGDLRDPYSKPKTFDTKKPYYTYNNYVKLCLQRLRNIYDNHCSYLSLSPLQDELNLHDKSAKDSKYREYVNKYIINALFGGEKHDNIINDQFDKYPFEVTSQPITAPIPPYTAPIQKNIKDMLDQLEKSCTINENKITALETYTFDMDSRAKRAFDKIDNDIWGIKQQITLIEQSINNNITNITTNTMLLKSCEQQLQTLQNDPVLARKKADIIQELNDEFDKLKKELENLSIQRISDAFRDQLIQNNFMKVLKDHINQMNERIEECCLNTDSVNVISDKMNELEQTIKQIEDKLHEEGYSDISGMIDVSDASGLSRPVSQLSFRSYSNPPIPSRVEQEIISDDDNPSSPFPPSQETLMKFSQQPLRPGSSASLPSPEDLMKFSQQSSRPGSSASLPYRSQHLNIDIAPNINPSTGYPVFSDYPDVYFTRSGSGGGRLMLASRADGQILSTKGYIDCVLFYVDKLKTLADELINLATENVSDIEKVKNKRDNVKNTLRIVINNFRDIQPRAYANFKEEYKNDAIVTEYVKMVGGYDDSSITNYDYPPDGLKEEILYYGFEEIKPEEALLPKIFALFPSNISYENIINLINEYFSSHKFHNCIYDNLVYDYYKHLIMWFVSATVNLMDIEIQNDLVSYIKKNKTTLYQSFDVYVLSVILNMEHTGVFKLNTKTKYINNIADQLQYSTIQWTNYMDFKNSLRNTVLQNVNVVPNEPFNIVLNNYLILNNNFVIYQIYDRTNGDKVKNAKTDFDTTVNLLYQRILNLSNYIKNNDYKHQRLRLSKLYNQYINNYNDYQNELNNTIQTDNTNVYNERGKSDTSVNDYTKAFRNLSIDLSLIRPDYNKPNIHLPPINDLHIAPRLHPNFQNSQTLLDDNDNFVFSLRNALDGTINKLFVFKYLPIPFAINLRFLNEYKINENIFVNPHEFEIDTSITSSKSFIKNMTPLLSIDAAHKLKINKYINYMLLNLYNIDTYNTEMHYSNISNLSYKLLNVKDFKTIATTNLDFLKVKASELLYHFKGTPITIKVDNKQTLKRIEHSIYPILLAPSTTNSNEFILANDEKEFKNLITDLDARIIKYKEISSKLPQLNSFSSYEKVFMGACECSKSYSGGNDNDNSLFFYDQGKSYTITIDKNKKETCQQIGYFRFNTALMRLLYMHQNLVRLILREIRKATLKRSTNNIVTGLALTDFNLTEEDLNI